MRSLRARLTIISTAVLIGVLGLASVAVVSLVEREIRSDLDEQNLATLEDIASQLESGADPFSIVLPVATDGTEFAITTEDGDYLNTSIAQTSFFEGDVSLGVSDLVGELVGDLRPGDVLVGPNGEEFIIPDDFDSEFFGTEIVTIDDQLVDEFFDDITFVSTSITTTDSDGFPLVVSAFSPTFLVDRSVGQVRSALLLIIPLLAAAFAAIAWFTTGRALKPVDEMTARADRISTDTLDQRLDQPGTNDEIDRLATTLNGMLERLDRGAQAQKQFVSDASHELQSPLTVMIGEAELASRDPHKLAAANELVVEHGRRMATLIQDLLDLSRTEEVVPNRVEVDLDELLRDEARLNPAAVDTSQVAPARVTGDARSLGRVFRNLIDNAVRHGDGQIKITCTSDDDLGRAIVTIDDNGAGIPHHDRRRVFDRFTRLDESRNRTTGGTGLGLAIAKSVVEAHGGTISIEDSPLGGARFLVHLPA